MQKQRHTFWRTSPSRTRIEIEIPAEVAELADAANMSLKKFVEDALASVKLSVPDDTVSPVLKPTIFAGRKKLPVVLELYSPARPVSQMTHPLLAKMLVEEYTEPGWTVLDPFCGTGVIPIVASHLGRRGIGIDLRPPLMPEERVKRFISEVLGERVEASYRRIKDSFDRAEISGVDAIISSPPYGEGIDGRVLSPLELPETYIIGVKAFWRKVRKMGVKKVVLIAGSVQRRDGTLFPAYAYWPLYTTFKVSRIHFYIEPRITEVIYVFENSDMCNLNR